MSISQLARVLSQWIQIRAVEPSRSSPGFYPFLMLLWRLLDIPPRKEGAFYPRCQTSCGV
ncbi:MAG TPA: hypothetical protein ENM97_05135 [Moorella mulderi]|nr:hypothetical protein [Moorella mulderi]